MRTLRLSLVGAVILTLLGGTGGAVLAQGDVTSASEPYAAVSGSVGVAGQVGSEEVEVSASLPEARVEGYDWWLRLTTDDPRLTGRYLTTQNYYLVFEGDDYSGALRSGRGRLTNDGGYWDAEFHGFTKPGTWVGSGNHYVNYLTGAAGYEGLTAMLFFLPTGTGAWSVEGVIFPGPMPEAPDELPATG